MSRARIVVPCARGTEALLAAELTALGIDAAPGRAEASGEATYDAALRACLWSRIASRVLWPLARVPAADPDALYTALLAFPIEEHLAVDRTFAVDVTLGSGTGEGYRHTLFAAQRVKDAIVDRLRERHGLRPDVDRERPDVRLHVHVAGDEAELAVDLAGDALHRRGYRADTGPAPLKENLAAALLLAMGWPARAAAGEPFLDPMCGSGTLVIEAAMIAGDRAPGLLRQRWGFSGWLGHDAAAWTPLAAEARERARAGLRMLDERGPFLGSDTDADAVAAAQRNAEIAGVAGRVSFQPTPLSTVEPPDGPGLVVTNPPYGERLGDEAGLPALYRELGDVLRHRFGGWQVGVFTAHGPLVGAIGLKPARREIFWNGPIECRLLDLPISVTPARSAAGPGWRKPEAASDAFANRLRKNGKHLAKWARREHVTCLRLYDADLPEYAVAVDLYAGQREGAPGAEQRWALVQEYAAPALIEPARAERRLRDVLVRTAEVLELDPAQVICKLRRRQKPTDQYGTTGERSARLVVEEGGHRFLVNLSERLDTGLFLDQRPLRARIGTACRDRRFLNLFSYTGSATVYAAGGGARSTTSVDLSKTYLAWSEDNFRLNALDPRHHRVVHDDCLRWLDVAAAGAERWDVIFLAPPTFSNSKRMEGVLDVQRDHAGLLAACAKLLAPGGEIFFVTHFRRFKLAPPPGLAVEELTKRTIPPDFARDARFHHAFRLTAGAPTPL